MQRSALDPPADAVSSPFEVSEQNARERLLKSPVRKVGTW
jgi:hypothetical protein